MKSAAEADTSVIRYWMPGQESCPQYYRVNGEPEGIYPEMFRQLENSGFRTERVIYKGDALLDAGGALEMLANGEIEMVLGLSQSENVADSVIRTDVIYADSLAAVILKDSPQVPRELAGNYYWGALSSCMHLLDGTALEGHTLDYIDSRELKQALANGDIYGAVLRRSEIDYRARIAGSFDCAEYEGFEQPYNECIYLNGRNTELNSLVTSAGEELARKYASDSQTRLAQYVNTLSKVSRSAKISTTAAYCGCALAVILAAAVTALGSKLKKRSRLEAAKLKVLYDAEPDKELFELDLKHNRITAYKGFKTFRIEEGALPDTVSLDCLSEELGYDFKKHFSGIAHSGMNSYSNRMIIYRMGRKLYIEEKGRKIGGRVLITMTDLTDSD